MARPQKLRDALSGLRRFAGHLRPALRDQRGAVLVAVAALLAETAFRLLEPWPLKFIIDRVVKSEAGDSAWAGLDTGAFLMLAAGALVVVTAARAAMGYVSAVGFARIGNRVVTRLREQVFRHLQELSLGFHDRARTGDLVVRVIGDIGMLRELAVTALLPLAANLLVLAGMLAVMFWLHWQLALLALSTLPLLWLMTLRRSRRIQALARRNRRREGSMAAASGESLGAIRAVQALSLDTGFTDSFARANAGALREGVRIKRLSAGLERSVDVLIALSTALVLWYGAHQVLMARLTPGELLVFVFYLRRAFRPLRDFAKYSARIAKASAAGERVMELLDQEPGVRERPDARPAPRFRGDIRLHRVCHAYDDGRLVLRDIDLHLAPGEHVALVGPSGSGKTTLASLILRLYDPLHGRVLIDGQDIREFTLASLRGQIAVVLQDTVLFTGTLRDNLLAGRPDASEDELLHAARLANAHGFISALPQGYDTPVGERGVTLSAGQRQRIAIARAALRDAPILLLDEPTTGLDPQNEQAVTAALERVSEGRTTLVITHRPDTAARMQRVLFLDNGRIEAAGHHFDLLHRHAAYARLFGTRPAGETQHAPAR